MLACLISFDLREMGSDGIRILLQHNTPLVWLVKDWMTLRSELRIMGHLIGCLAQLPRQEVQNGLPMLLLPEEVTFLLEKKLAHVVEYKNPGREFTDEEKKSYEEYLKQASEQQIQFQVEKKKMDLTGMIDRIVEGKKRKLVREQDKALTDVEVDRDAIFQAELERSTADLASGLSVHIPTVNPFAKEEDFTPVEWVYPSTELERLKYRVFKDLHERGYYITGGTKFGGHFLVYPGEPLKFHAFFTVLCQLPTVSTDMSSVVIHARLGTSTKKTFVIATTTNGDGDSSDLSYFSFEWTGKT